MLPNLLGSMSRVGGGETSQPGGFPPGHSGDMAGKVVEKA